MRTWIRSWIERDITEIEQNLLIIGDSVADCAKCKELGLDYKTVKTCPNCKTVFSYVTSRRFNTNPGERFHIVKRLNEIRNDLIWIDYDDFKTLTGRQKARDFFKD